MGSSVRGFTLIELSIVLIIIGLIVGGVLVGQNLIGAAQVRATITQLEQFQTAANTFKGRYGYYPGDIKDPEASSFGFAARVTSRGTGDGNGVIEGFAPSPFGSNGFDQGAGETTMFWSDLTYANGHNLGLIPGSFSVACTSCITYGGQTPYTTPSLDAFFPTAALGNGNYFTVVSQNGLNYFGLSVVSNIYGTGMVSGPGLTVKQSYSIDSKIDDGCLSSAIQRRNLYMRTQLIGRPAPAETLYLALQIQ